MLLHGDMALEFKCVYRCPTHDVNVNIRMSVLQGYRGRQLHCLTKRLQRRHMI